MPPFDPQKHSPVQSLHQFAEHAVDSALDLLSKSLPCTVDDVDDSGTIVMVKVEIEDPNVVFPLIQCPVAGPEFIRYPLKKGDKGVMFSADYYIGEMSGLGTGKADLTPQFNLSMGVFFPIGNKKTPPVDDADKNTTIYGRDGGGVAILGGPPQDPETNFTGPPPPKITVDKDGFKVYIDGQLKFIIDAQGARYIGNPIPNSNANFGINTTPGGTFIDGINFLPHQHLGVQTGSSTSGPVDESPL